MGEAVMADPMRIFAFRRALTIDPYILPVNSATVPVAVQIDQAGIRAAGVTSFKIMNPTNVWVWYRGWNGSASDMPAIKEKGHYLPPGGIDVNTSQIPQWIAAHAQAEPGFPLPSDFTGYRLIMVYGSGL